MALFLTVVTGSNVTINDLGARTFAQGLTTYKITDEFSVFDLEQSTDLSASLAAGDVTIQNEYSESISVIYSTNTVYDIDGDGRVDTANSSSLAISSSYVDWLNVDNIPSLVSGSAQIDYNGITNVPSGIVSSSAQIATEISGAFNDTSASLSSRVTTLETTGVQNAATASYVEYADVANKPTLVSGSSQISYNGITDVPAGIVSSSAQIATEISGAFTADSASFEIRISNNEATASDHEIRIDNLETATGSYVRTDLGDAANQTVQGTLTLTGDIIAENYIISSSVTYMTQSFSSGSTIFGDTLDDTHQFTGSVSITGSLQLVDGTQQVGYVLTSDANGNASWAVTPEPASSASFSTRVTNLESTSSDHETRIDSLESVTGSYATTGSNVFIGNQIISGSLTVTGSDITLIDGIFNGNGSGLTDVPLSWQFTAGNSSKNISSQFLKTVDGTFTNLTPFICPVNCELIAITSATDGTYTWVAEVHKNGTLDEDLSISAADKAFFAGYSSSYVAGDEVSLRLNGTNIDRPQITAWFREV